MGKRSPYAEAVDSVRTRRAEMIGSAPPPSVVARTVLRLARSRSPRPFTVVGKPFLTFLVRHAPRGLLAVASARMTGMRPLGG